MKKDTKHMNIGVNTTINTTDKTMALHQAIDAGDLALSRTLRAQLPQKCIEVDRALFNRFYSGFEELVSVLDDHYLSALYIHTGMTKSANPMVEAELRKRLVAEQVPFHHIQNAIMLLKKKPDNYVQKIKDLAPEIERIKNLKSKNVLFKKMLVSGTKVLDSALKEFYNADNIHGVGSLADGRAYTLIKDYDRQHLIEFFLASNQSQMQKLMSDITDSEHSHLMSRYLQENRSRDSGRDLFIFFYSMREHLDVMMPFIERNFAQHFKCDTAMEYVTQRKSTMAANLDGLEMVDKLLAAIEKEFMHKMLASAPKKENQFKL